jgi:hypothetical protein
MAGQRRNTVRVLKTDEAPEQQLSGRDLELLDILVRAGTPMTMGQLQLAQNRSYTATWRTLARLRNHGLVEVLSETLSSKLPLFIPGGQLYAIRMESSRIIEERLGYIGVIRARLASWAAGRLVHHLVTTQFWLDAVHAMRTIPQRSVRWWGTPHLTRVRHRVQGKQRQVEHFAPDGLLLLAHHDPQGFVVRERAWFVEIDMGTEPLERLRKKLRTYETWWRSGEWQQDSLFSSEAFPPTFVVTMTPERADWMTTAFQDLLVKRGIANELVFLVSTFSEVAASAMRGPIWRTTMPGAPTYEWITA